MPSIVGKPTVHVGSSFHHTSHMHVTDNASTALLSAFELNFGGGCQAQALQWSLLTLHSAWVFDHAASQLCLLPVTLNQNNVIGERHPLWYISFVMQGYSTLGSQWLMKGYDHNPVLTHPAVVKAAATEGRSAAQVVLRWAVQHGQVSAHHHHAICLDHVGITIARYCCDLGYWMSKLCTHLHIDSLVLEAQFDMCFTH